MGVDESSGSKIQSKDDQITISLFELLYVIGRGGFGKVWKVQYKRTKHQFALKEMSKVKIIDRKSEKSIKGERDFLSQLHNPFIVNMICSFQDKDNLYLVMDLLNGGDLRYHICHRRKFTEEQTKFFIACVLVGLEYIHSNNVIHRDIKPENLVCDENGYIALTDFGVAKRKQKDNSSETSGTPGYMAPEVLCALNHSFPVDFFALGVMGYEFMLGMRPYVGKNRKEIKELVLSRQAQIKTKNIPDDWSQEAVDFINSLLQRKPSHRLGYNNILEVKNHPWFSNFDWEELVSKKMKSPFQPKYGDNFDKKYCEGIEKIGTETQERYNHYRKKGKYLTLFDNYTFCRYNTEKIEKMTQNNRINHHQNPNNQNNSSFIKPFSFNNILNSTNYLRSASKQGSLIYNSIQPQSFTSMRQLQTPQSTNQIKRTSSTKQSQNYNHLFYDSSGPLTSQCVRKPLPVLHQNSSMKYLNINSGALSLYGLNGILNREQMPSRSIIKPHKTHNLHAIKYGLTSNNNYNPFLKKSSSMPSIKHGQY